MLFNSFEFLFLFLPIVYSVYFFLRARSVFFAKPWLLLSSFFFYGWWKVDYLPLLLGSIIFNYLLGSAISQPQQHTSTKKFLLGLGVFANIALLGFFKYASFFAQNLAWLTGLSFPPIKIALPLAISFFTFQQIAYLVDTYRDEVDSHNNFLNYALFVSFFPQLIAGPIVQQKDTIPQFADDRARFSVPEHLSAGMFLLSVGLFKKVMIADHLAPWVKQGFDLQESLPFFMAWATSFSYTFQLYFDFSGYTDMALGIALLFNIQLAANFQSPYKSLDIQDFWRRWHITLSRFLRTYLYIPLGGNRGTTWQTHRNLMLTFLIGGIWHGAGWTFVFWGGLHGTAIVLHRMWQMTPYRLPRVVAWFVTFQFVNITWVFFRAKTWKDAIKVLKGMAGMSGVERSTLWLGQNKWQVLFLVTLFVICLFPKNSMKMLEEFQPSPTTAFACVAMLLLSFLHLSQFSEFLYFNF